VIVTETVAAQPDAAQEQSASSLGTVAARNLATTTKTEPQMQGISSRWLLRALPWVEVAGGTYRVNRRLSYVVGDGRLTFTNAGSDVRVVPQELRELPLLRDFEDEQALSALAQRFVQREIRAGEVIVEFGHEADQLYLIAHGKVDQIGSGRYDSESRVGVLADGQYFGAQTLSEPNAIWEYTVKAVTPGTVLVLTRQSFDELLETSPPLREHVERIRADGPAQPQNKHGEADIAVASGHDGEPALPGTFVDYETAPREYELSVAQTVLRVHTRVADLYNEPMNQVEQQVRLTVEALRERQENEMVNNRDFGLLHNADLKQRVSTRSGPPTPDDLDELLSMRRSTRLMLAHPKAIAAFGRECNSRGIYPDRVEVDGHQIPAWRGVPMYPCGKIPISEGDTSAILAMRTGEDDQGVVGLRPAAIPDQYEPGLNVRFMGVDEKAIISYLVSTYYSAAVLVPDALGVLENVEVSRWPSE
jgi:encapsulin shell SprI-like protein/cyclic nucleotide-binding protein